MDPSLRSAAGLCDSPVPRTPALAPERSVGAQFGRGWRVEGGARRLAHPLRLFQDKGTVLILKPERIVLARSIVLVVRSARLKVGNRLADAIPV